MHEAAFAQAAWPRKAVILKLPLRDFSMIHALRLWERNSPFMVGGEVEPQHVREGVLVCSHTYEELQRMEKDWLIGLKMRLWGRRIRGEDYALAAADLKNHIAAGSTEPPIDEALDPAKTVSRSPGSPFVLILLQFLLLKLGKTEAEAMNFKYGLAKWHYCAYWEQEQALRVKSAADLEFDKFIAENEAKIIAEQKVKEAKCPA